MEKFNWKGLVYGLLFVIECMHLSCSSRLLCMDGDTRSNLEKELDRELAEEIVKREILKIKLKVMYKNIFCCENKINALFNKKNDKSVQTELTLITNKSIVSTETSVNTQKIKKLKRVKSVPYELNKLVEKEEC